jgi:hypothetical protein
MDGWQYRVRKDEEYWADGATPEQPKWTARVRDAQVFYSAVAAQKVADQQGAVTQRLMF